MREEGAGGPSVGEGFGGKGEVDQLEAGAAVLLGQCEAAHAHFHEALPERRVVARVAVEHFAHPGCGTLVLDELSESRLEQLLFFRGIQVHFPELLWA